MRRRIILLSAFLAASVLALSALPARAQQSYLVFFHEWSAELDPAARDVVAAAAAHAKQNPALRVDVTGFASTEGSARANLFLSMLRAQLVADQLVAAGVEAARIAPVGEGAVSSVGSTQEARRVEITFRAR